LPSFGHITSITFIFVLFQNPRDSGEGPSQCNRNQKNSKCECCCTESMCNAGLCPYNFTRKFWFVSVQHASITPK